MMAVVVRTRLILGRGAVLRTHDRRCASSTSSTTHAESKEEDTPPTQPAQKNTDSTPSTGSAKLFADALLEESSPSSSSSASSKAARLLALHADENWTGDERVQDTVLRMLVDKHKPLRGPTIRSAEEKLRAAPPQVFRSSHSVVIEDESESKAYKPDWQTRATAPLLPAIEGHRPWHTTFISPASAQGRIKLGTFSSSSSRSPASARQAGAIDTPKQDPCAARRALTAQRLGRARESTLDYRLGLGISSPSPSPSSPSPPSSSGSQSPVRRPTPLGVKGWTSLAEERIERARRAGHFTNLKGRGKPLDRETAERNPFIAREEFLMNRIVQRNQAAPPWVELQLEVETAIHTFRSILLQTWTRRAIRLLTASRAPSSLHALTLSDARALRDSAWAAREAGYHASALGEVNELVRRYNGVAPYTARKPFFEVGRELERAYWEGGEGVLEGVRERVRKGVGRRENGGSGEEEGGIGGGGGGVAGEEERSVWDRIRAWIASLRG